MTEDGLVSAALSIAGILDYEPDLVDRVEGELLVAGGRDETITPLALGREVSTGRDAAGNLFRQLAMVDAAMAERREGQVLESEYRLDTAVLRQLFRVTRQAIWILEADRQRRPPETVAEPLVTFPDDPAFTGETAARFGMSQLLSAIATEVKNTDESIVIVAPFFEGTGFDRLYDVLGDAVARGVDLTFITRYLADRKSHNRSVIGEFVESLREGEGNSGRIRTFDYTVWDESVPSSERRQGGAKPAFTLHAKMMLFDGEAAYIGSANVTDYGFDRYLELGVLLRGPPVTRYRRLLESLLSSDASREIQL